jgi:hypothetical protein
MRGPSPVYGHRFYSPDKIVFANSKKIIFASSLTILFLLPGLEDAQQRREGARTRRAEKPWRAVPQGGVQRRSQNLRERSAKGHKQDEFDDRCMQSNVDLDFSMDFYCLISQILIVLCCIFWEFFICSVRPVSFPNQAGGGPLPCLSAGCSGPWMRSSASR